MNYMNREELFGLICILKFKQMKTILIIFIAFTILSCNKEDTQVDVTYRISKAYSTTAITYRDQKGIMNSDTLHSGSGEDMWSYSFTGEKGNIVYVSAIYQDSASSVTVDILLDGKIYKSGSSNNEPEKYVIVSGTIPY